MQIKTLPTFRVEVFLAGDLATAEGVCREYCHRVGLCVTVCPTKFFYVGGQENGVRVGLADYPRFPSSREQLKQHARSLAVELIEKCCQHSALVVGDDETQWMSLRDESKAAK